MMYLTHKLEEYFYIFHLVKIKEHLQWLLGGQYRNEPARAGLQSQTNDVDSRYTHTTSRHARIMACCRQIPP